MNNNDAVSKDALRAALAAMKVQRAALDTHILEMEGALNDTSYARTAPSKRATVTRPAGAVKRTMSPEARARIAAAQKKRWAVINKASATAPQAAPTAKKVAAKRVFPRKKAAEAPNPAPETTEAAKSA